jgi:hypothetical protein
VAFLVVGQGTQFITGPCTSDADCASGCCGFNTGKCAGPVFAQEVDGGCGFGNAQPNDNAALSLLGSATAAAVAQTTIQSTIAAAAAQTTIQSTIAAAAVQASTATTTAIKSAGTQFITGPCTSDADCADGCCGFNTGKCAGPVVAQEIDGGCGFGNAQPNSNAALSLLGSTAATEPTATVAAPQASTTTTGASKSAGTQFITGPCTSDADCADGCCGFNTGKCAGPVVAQEIDGGCGFGDAQPNDNAARALGASKRGIPYWA